MEDVASARPGGSVAAPPVDFMAEAWAFADLTEALRARRRDDALRCIERWAPLLTAEREPRIDGVATLLATNVVAPTWTEALRRLRYVRSELLASRVCRARARE